MNDKKPLIICNECPFFTVLGFKFYCDRYKQEIKTATVETLNNYFLYHAIDDCIKEWLKEIEQEQGE